MPCRNKHRHRPRHHTHAVKLANRPKSELKPVIPVYVETPAGAEVTPVGATVAPAQEMVATSQE